MKIDMLFKFTLIVVLSFSNTIFASDYTSKFVGQEHRQIKSLSSDDINELKQGSGWGLARTAELNGLPGPAHIPDMKNEIHLSDDQSVQILVIYNEMKKNAVDLGKTLIDLETKMDIQFANKTITRATLAEMVSQIEKVKAELRFVHLSAHLLTPKILTTEQITLYNQLRGYTDDTCDKIPEGHSAEMWKKHNGCN